MRTSLAIMVGGAIACVAMAQTGGLQPLPVALPKPLFEGTPELPNVPNLEKPLGRPRPPFLAPAGVANVAQGKLVSSSDSAPVIGNLDMITDGNKAGTDGTFVELKEGPQSVVIDLEEKHTLYAILVWHYHKEARAYLDVIVQVADDPDFITNVRTIFNNDNDNTAGFGLGKDLNYVETAEGKLIDAKGVEARYVRLISNGSNKTKANHYVEVEAFGKPVQ
ncbi:MAG: hypothetical protein IT158_28500 [Bryobacterales bacterium]|nr:hypothetical protein [Bryobacterales bacterium]